MSKKVLKISGALSAVFAILSLYLPVFHAIIGVGETWDAVFRGFDLAEFSVWGAIVFLAPPILFGIAFSKARDSVKSLLIMLPVVLGIAALHISGCAMREWVMQNASGHVQPFGGLVLYPVLLLFSAVLLWVSFRLEDAPEALIKPIDILSKKFILFPHRVTFTKVGKELPYAEFDGCVSFATEDGYFAALGHGDDLRYIKSGCIEFSDESDSLRGFAMRTMPFGIYGSFYEDCTFGSIRLNVLPFSEIIAGEGRLLLPDGEGDFSEIPVTLNPICVTHIDCRLSEDLKKESPIDGAVVVQQGKIAAVVSEYDEENKKYICVSSEIPAADLARMVYEQKVAEKLRELGEI